MDHPLDFICFSLNIDHSLYSQASWGFRDNISGLQEAQCQVGEFNMSMGSSSIWYGKCKDAQVGLGAQKQPRSRWHGASKRFIGWSEILPKEDRLEALARSKGAGSIDIGIKVSCSGSLQKLSVARTI